MWAGAVLVAPIVGVAAWWLLVGLLHTGGASGRHGLAIGLIVVAVTAVIAYGRRHGIDGFWIAAAVVAFFPVTALVGVVSLAAVVAVACRDGACA